MLSLTLRRAGHNFLLLPLRSSCLSPRFQLSRRTIRKMSTEQTIPSKRQLEEEEPGEAETSTGVRRRLHGGEDEHTDDKAETALSKPSHFDSTAPAAAVEAQPEAGPSTLQSAPRGKNKKVPLSRKEAREARKSNNTRRGTRPERTDGEEGREKKESSEPRLPKRQCALLLGFCGSGYSGMQLYVSSNYTLVSCGFAIYESC